MARGRKKRRINERTYVVKQKRDKQKEQEFLNSEVDINKLGDHGIDDLIRAVVFELPKASEVEAKEIALALQKALRGDASIEANPDLHAIKKEIMEEAATIDKAAEQFEKDRESFIAQVLADAPKLSKEEKEKLQAKGRAMMGDAIKKTKAQQAVTQLQFKQRMADAPLVDVHVTGRFVRDKERGMVQLPEELRVMGMSWTLDPGVQKLPKPLAEIYNQRQRERLFNNRTKELFSGKGASYGFYDQEDLARKIVKERKQILG